MITDLPAASWIGAARKSFGVIARMLGSHQLAPPSCFFAFSTLKMWHFFPTASPGSPPKGPLGRLIRQQVERLQDLLIHLIFSFPGFLSLGKP